MMKNATADDIQNVIRDIYEQHGRCTPQQLVNEARSQDSPLHDLFDWSDTSAAEKWRRDQGRRILRRYRIDVESGSRVPRNVSCSITVGGTTHRGYVPIEEITADDMWSQVVSETRAQLRGLRKRLSAFDKARNSVAHIDAAISSLGDDNA